VVIQIDGRNLPGIRCNPGPNTGVYENIHVGVGPLAKPNELFRGDATATSWRVDVRVVRVSDSSLDYRGPMVSGKRGDRFIYLNWGTIEPDGEFRLMRRAKVDLSALDPAMVRRALEGSTELHCLVDLTDAKGNPTCARFRPPAASWRVVAPSTAGA
jgi:uncharacterized protein DUF5990